MWYVERLVLVLFLNNNTVVYPIISSVFHVMTLSGMMSVILAVTAGCHTMSYAAPLRPLLLHILQGKRWKQLCVIQLHIACV